MYVLFIFQQGPMQFWQGIHPVALEVFWGQIFGQKKFQPVDHF